MKKLIPFILFLFFPGELFAQETNFKTFEFTANIDDVTTPNAGLAAALDAEHNTHIAWIEQKDGLRSVMYSLYNGQSVETTKIYQGADKEAPVAPAIALDNNNNPHITFFVKRNTSMSIKSGNYAVYYAGKTGGDFQVEQVSTNPTDPDEDTGGIFNCYVNGRPQITNKNGTIVITYLSATGSFNGWDNYIISASLLNGAWELKQEYNIDEIANVSPDDDISLPVLSDDGFLHAFIDNSDSDPFVCYYDNGWSNYMISGYTGWTDNDDIHVDLVNNSDYYLSWLHEGDDKTVFAGVNLTSNEVTEYPVSKTPAGNFAPSTYDLTTGDFIGFYTEDWTLDGYLVTTDENGFIVETKLESEDIGITFGKRVLNARDGYISLVTAAESREKIYISTNTGTSSTNILPAQKSEIGIKTYPNPFKNSFVVVIPDDQHIQTLKVFDLDGRLIKQQSVYQQKTIRVNLEEAGEGLYLLQLSGKTGNYNKLMHKL